MATPLTPQDKIRLDDAQKRLTEAQELIRQARQAGFDVSALDARAQEMRGQIIKIKQAFFPGQ